MIQEASSNADRLAQLRVIAWITIIVLFAQFLLGMWLNLFASFPVIASSTPGMAGMMSSMMAFMTAGGMPALMVHMFIGFLLVIVSIVGVAAAAYSGEARTIVLSGLGLVSIIVGGVGGLGFMFSGFQDNFFSYVMATGFLLAFMAYFAILYVAKGSR